jgi:chromosome segregation ATPase
VQKIVGDQKPGNSTTAKDQSSRLMEELQSRDNIIAAQNRYNTDLRHLVKNSDETLQKLRRQLELPQDCDVKQIHESIYELQKAHVKCRKLQNDNDELRLAMEQGLMSLVDQIEQLKTDNNRLKLRIQALERERDETTRKYTVLQESYEALMNQIESFAPFSADQSAPVGNEGLWKSINRFMRWSNPHPGGDVPQ